MNSFTKKATNIFIIDINILKFRFHKVIHMQFVVVVELCFSDELNCDSTHTSAKA